jgi:Outer membrane protein beta-barrel domain
MTKIILCVLTSLTFAAITSAQSFHIGAKAGANLTKIDGQSFRQSYELGYQVGGFLELNLNKNWGIQPEVLFSQTNTIVDSGFKAIYQDIDNAIIGQKAHLNYLSIPILLRLNAGDLLTFNLGPQFSILMNKDQSLVHNGKQAFKNGDVAAVLGAQINLGSLKLYGRYNIGLNNLNDIDNQDKWKSRQLQFGLGLRIL